MLFLSLSVFHLPHHTAVLENKLVLRYYQVPSYVLCILCTFFVDDKVTVPTAETASATFWMEQRMGMGKPVMLVGPAGTGKTQLVMGALRNLMTKGENSYLTSKINMNFYTR